MPRCLLSRDHHVIIWTNQGPADVLRLSPCVNVKLIHVDRSDRKMSMPSDLETGVRDTKTANRSTAGDPCPSTAMLQLPARSLVLQQPKRTYSVHRTVIKTFSILYQHRAKTIYRKQKIKQKPSVLYSSSSSSIP